MPTACLGRRGLRSRSLLTCLGLVDFKFPYVPKGYQVAFTLKALGWNARVTPAAKRHISRAGALSGSFAEARETLMDLAKADCQPSLYQLHGDVQIRQRPDPCFET